MTEPARRDCVAHGTRITLFGLFAIYTTWPLQPLVCKSQRDPLVRGITCSYIYVGIPSWQYTPQFPSMRWNLLQLHQRGLTGEGIVIAVLDDGIDPEHLAIKERFYENPCSIEGVSLVACDGQAHFGKLCDPNTTCWKVPNPHGTAVAAVAGGRSFQSPDNIVIPDGVAPRAALFICRQTDMKKALEHILHLVTTYKKQIDIVCMPFTSLAGSDENIEVLLSRLVTAGVVCVAAAGNEGDYQRTAGFPARDTDVISVGALKLTGQISDMNPQDRSSISVYAPGEDLCVPIANSLNVVGVQSGTSFAAPMVAGFIALLIQFSKCCPGTTDKVVKMYHHTKFLKVLFNHPELSGDRRLLHVDTFLDKIFNKEIDMIALIKTVYNNFTP